MSEHRDGRPKREHLLSARRLRELLDYSPDIGEFTWRARPVTHHRTQSTNSRIAGKRAGSLVSKYWSVFIVDMDRHVRAHRLAWLYMTGAWPEHFIDHINGDKLDNRFCNLREATKAQNMRNTGLRKDNTSGLKGAHRYKDRWTAFIGINGKTTYLGIFATKEEAHEAYKAAADKHFGAFARAA